MHHLPRSFIRHYPVPAFDRGRGGRGGGRGGAEIKPALVRVVGGPARVQHRAHLAHLLERNARLLHELRRQPQHIADLPPDARHRHRSHPPLRRQCQPRRPAVMPVDHIPVARNHHARRPHKGHVHIAGQLAHGTPVDLALCREKLRGVKRPFLHGDAALRQPRKKRHLVRPRHLRHGPPRDLQPEPDQGRALDVQLAGDIHRPRHPHHRVEHVAEHFLRHRRLLPLRDAFRPCQRSRHDVDRHLRRPAREHERLRRGVAVDDRIGAVAVLENIQRSPPLRRVLRDRLRLVAGRENALLRRRIFAGHKDAFRHRLGRSVGQEKLVGHLARVGLRPGQHPRVGCLVLPRNQRVQIHQSPVRGLAELL